MARLPDGYRVEPGTGRLVRITARECTVTQFMRRISLAEYVTLNAIIMDPTQPLSTRSELQTIKDIRDGTRDKMVSLDDDDTQLGVAIAINTLVSLPEAHPVRIPVEQAAARVDAWLVDFPQPGEPS